MCGRSSGAGTTSPCRTGLRSETESTMAARIGARGRGWQADYCAWPNQAAGMNGELPRSQGGLHRRLGSEAGTAHCESKSSRPEARLWEAGRRHTGPSAGLLARLRQAWRGEWEKTGRIFLPAKSLHWPLKSARVADNAHRRLSDGLRQRAREPAIRLGRARWMETTGAGSEAGVLVRLSRAGRAVRKEPARGPPTEPPGASQDGDHRRRA